MQSSSSEHGRNEPGAALLAESGAGDNAAPLSVSEISRALKRAVEQRFGHVRIRGEISGFKRAASGHCYMGLKDESAVIDGVIWKGQAARLAFAPEDGIEVIATGKLTTYPGRSKYQIVIERLEVAGEGALMQLLEQRRKALAAEGLFAEDRKRALPYLPKTIGVVTSPTGAVIRDILHRLADRMPSHVIVWPVIVQGEGAAAQIANAVRGFDSIEAGAELVRPDLLIVARGGGSIEDLWAFNEEVVVRAIADCTIPVISAVGHETDTTLADFVADRRAPTPTASAEMAVPVRAELLAMLGETSLRLGRAIRRLADRLNERLHSLGRLLPRPANLLAPHAQKFDDLSGRLPRALSGRLQIAHGELARRGAALRPILLRRTFERGSEALARANRDLPTAMTERLTSECERLAALTRVLAQLDPKAPLQRGFALVETQDEKVIADAEAARRAGALRLRFADGSVDARVEDGAKAAYPKSRKAKSKPKSGQPGLFD